MMMATIMMATILSTHSQWFLRVAAVLFLVFLGGHRCGWAVFIKVQATVFPAVSRYWICVVVFLEISYYLGAAVFEGIFSGSFLFLFIVIFILLPTSVQSCRTCSGLLQLAYKKVTMSVPGFFGFVFLFALFYYFWTAYDDLVVMLLLINLLSFTLKIIFPHGFNLLFQSKYIINLM